MLLTNEDRYKQNTRLVVDGEGHVGIGIADPRVQLDVSGKVSILIVEITILLMTYYRIQKNLDKKILV